MIGGISKITKAAIKGTIFENRTYKGRGQSISETATTMILDLATVEQVVLYACTYGVARAEHLKDMHVDTYLPIVHDFLAMLERLFGDQWPENTPDGSDPYRAIFVHGWSFCFKALARAYYRARIDELGPLADALKVDDLDAIDQDSSELWAQRAQELAENDAQLPAAERKYAPPITVDELERRLKAIDWVRHRKHWVDITGFTRNVKDGKPNTKVLADKTEVVEAKAPTQKEVIAGIEGTILGPDWSKLQGTADFDWKALQNRPRHQPRLSSLPRVESA